MEIEFVLCELVFEFLYVIKIFSGLKYLVFFSFTSWSADKSLARPGM